MTEDVISGWCSRNTKPVGKDRKMLLRVEEKGGRKTKIVIGEWRSAEGCFAFDKFDNANHLVVYWSWIDLTEPTEEMIAHEFRITYRDPFKST